MPTSIMDPYYNLLCAILKKAQSDAIIGEDPSYRRWIHSPDALELCEMANINYLTFRNIVLKKIEEHDTKKKSK